MFLLKKLLNQSKANMKIQKTRWKETDFWVNQKLGIKELVNEWVPHILSHLVG